MMIDVMLDLETMGKGSNAAIVAIGAVKFDTEIRDVFYRTVDLASSVAAGGVMDASTVLWWLKQSDAARAELQGITPLSAALAQFTEWLGDPNHVSVWGNGAAFDNVILANAYRSAGIPVPWHYWRNMCYRTVKGLHPEVPFVRLGEHHHALNDAESQAHHLMAILAS